MRSGANHPVYSMLRLSSGSFLLVSLVTCLACDNTALISSSLEGEIHVVPARILADGKPSGQVSVLVYLSGSAHTPVQGATVVVNSSRNQVGAAVDTIQQSGSPTDADGQAAAFVGSSTEGDAELTVTIRGKPLCQVGQGASCVPATATVTFYTGCQNGWTSCNGVCVDTDGDPNNCGDCGRVCALDHAVAGCQNGACTVAGCDDGWGDCNKAAVDGCETDLGNDRLHCGTCDTTCGIAQDCLGGTCTLQCPDQDSDGYTNQLCGGSDCNDNDPNVHPGAVEVCDGIDNNCDGLTDEEPAADASCDDHNPCTDDLCRQGKCIHANNSAPCDDQNPCTMNDTCAGGACAGQPLDADHDGYVSSACGGNDCNDSDPNINPGVFEGPVGSALCSDGIDNNCDGLTDQGQPSCQPCTQDSDCDNQDVCDGAETCSNHQCVPGTKLICDDQNVCTNDSCDPINGCQHANNSLTCDDGDACTVGDVCSNGACQPGTARICNDNNVCTDDSCDTVTGCQVSNNTAPCDDGNACTVNDTCAGGTCVAGPSLQCDDQNSCTDDSCDPKVGCVYTDNTASCDDGDACTSGDHCSSGGCVGTPVICNDGNGCTDDNCDPGTGCFYVNNAAPCDDGNACTLNDHCAGGGCVPGPTPDCNDLNPCTDDTCDPASGCVHTNNTLPCDDGDACTLNDTCAGGACVPGPSPNCDDQNPCTDDSCDHTRGCVHVNNTAHCDIGNHCSTQDICSGGVCTAGPTDKDSDSDSFFDGACPGGTDCNDNNPAIHPGAKEGPYGDPTCSDHVDNNCDGLTDTQDPNCMQCQNASDCNDNNPCTIDNCVGNVCQHAPAGEGSNCGAAFCNGLLYTGMHCRSGTCTAELVQDCNDGLACTTDSCDPQTGCTNLPPAVDLNSNVTASSACLTLGAGGRSTVFVDLRDSGGSPLAGATVSFAVSGQAVSWVEGSVVESTALPGVYYRTLVAPSTGSSTTVSASVVVCGQPAGTLAQTVTVGYSAANAGTGGTGGCSPADGNLRVRVLAAETSAPISGAHVMMGLAQGTPFAANVEDFLAGRAPAGSNTALTDGNGYVSFWDLGTGLDGPLTVTAGQPDSAPADRAYFTFDRVRAADLVLPLRLSRPPQTIVHFTTGTQSGFDETSSDKDIQGALVLPEATLTDLTKMDLNKMLAPSRCIQIPSNPDSAVPENMYFPRQCMARLPIIGCVAYFSEARWALDFPRNHRLNMDMLNLTQSVMQNYCEFSEVLADVNVSPYATYKGRIGFAPSSATGADTANYSMPLNYQYPRLLTVNASGKPATTDLFGLVLGDYNGSDGSGPSYLNGVKLTRYNAGNSNQVLTYFAANGTQNLPVNPDPGAARYYAAAIALYLDPVTGRPPASRPDTTADLGASTVLWRDNSSGNAPLSGSADATWSVGSFLQIAKLKISDPANKNYVFDNAAANGVTPQLSLHELYRLTSTYRGAPLSCAYERDVVSTVSDLYWEVWRPYELTCSDTTGTETTPNPKECFSLPNLPSAWPRAGANATTGKVDGLAALHGSGKDCVLASDCSITGDNCVQMGKRCNAQRHKSCNADADCRKANCWATNDTCSAVEQICVANDGVNDYSQVDNWSLSVGYLDLRGGPAFNFNHFNLTDWLTYLTNASTNRLKLNQ